MTELDVDFKKYQKELRLTQQDAAMLLGATRMTYIRYEADPDSMPLGKYRQQLMQHFERFRDLKISS